MLGASVALLILTALPAHATQLFFEPAFLYQFANVQGCGYCTNHGPGPWQTSLSQAWADAQADVNNCGSGYCWTAFNLRQDTRVNAIDFDGIPYAQYFDVQSCLIGGGGCNTYPETGWLQTTYGCPTGTSAGNYNSPATNRLIACSFTLPAQPPPICHSCIGNPIYAATGQKAQIETDYSGVPGLGYTRTYRSSNGFFSSIASTGYLDFSQTSISPLGPCYSGSWAGGTTPTVSGCFPFIGTGQTSSQYALATADGRYIQFSGPSGSITQSADVNERVVQITFNGAMAWQVARGDNSAEVYNAAGSLIQKTLRGGEVITYTYSTSSTPSTIAPRPGLLIGESDPFGHTLSWQYNAAALVTQMTDPAGGVYQYRYDGVGNLTGVTYPDSSTKTYSYNESANTGGTNLPHALTGITDESVVRFATFNYDSYGRGTGTQHAGGVDSYTLSYQGSTPGVKATVTDPLGTVRTYQFQAVLSYEQDSSVSQPAASGSGTVTTTYTDDANGNVSQLTDFNGNITKYSYDLTRNLETSRTEAYGTSQARTITTQWSTAYRLPTLVSVYAGGSATGTPLRTTAFTYDSAANQLTKTITDTTVTPNVTRTWTYTYDSYGRILTAKGPRTDVDTTTTYTYYTCTTGYQCGQVHTVTDALSHVTTYNTYNAHGQPLTITDPNGVVTTLAYDGRMRLTSRQVGTETTTFSYYPTGLLKKVTLPDSSYILYTHDNAHRLTQISDGAGNSVQYTLDNMGNRTAEKTYDPSSVLHRTHTRVYNSLNALYQDINAAGTSAVTTTYGYDNNGNQTTINAPLNRNTTDAYDPLNRLAQITDPANGNTYFGYDANDNLTSVKDPRSLTTSYGYNGFGDVKSQSSPDTGPTSSTYDSGGNLATSTDARGAVATYTHDSLNRVTSVAYKIGGTTDQTITFTYDTGTNGIGRLSGASDANHSMSWTYDGRGRVTGKGQVVGGVTRSIGYGYTNGNLTSIVTPSGQTVSYGYNTDHQITSISVNSTTVLSAVTYEPLGPVNGWTWGNGTTTTRTYDQDQKITQISSQGVRTLTYDNAFRITGLTDTTTGGINRTYGYDLLDRITSSIRTGTTRGWTYDANGNRLTETGTYPSTYTISPTSNRITGITGQLPRTYSYDSAGNVQGYATVTAGYNDRGRLQSITNSGSTASFIYNALGQMAESNGTAGLVLYAYDEAGHLQGEYDGAGHLIEETVWLGDIPVATLRPSGSTVAIYYVHSDQLNTPHVVTRPSDNIQVWTWFSDAFGSNASAGTLVYNLRFPGQIYMAAMGLNQNWNRDYDPQVGRYEESDPIGLTGGLNTYRYVASRPTMATDSTGLVLRGSGWSDPEWNKIQAAEQQIRKELSKSCSCPRDGIEGCIPCESPLLSNLRAVLDTSTVYTGREECGSAPVGAKWLRLTPAAFTSPGCGCLALSLYHELLHDAGLSHHDPAGDRVSELDRKCRGNLCGTSEPAMIGVQ